MKTTLAILCMLVLAVPVAATAIDVPGDYPTIQAAIDAASSGDVINVAAGTYTEQVYITKSLTLKGIVSSSKPVIRAPAAASRSTYNIPESGRTFDPLVFADGGTGVIVVTVENLEIDGNNDGGTKTFCGILFRSTNPGVIRGNDLHSLKGTSQETMGILIYASNTDVAVSCNTIRDFSRNGITANVGATVAIAGNTVTGDGPLPAGYWAQNGIQIGYGARGSITSNTVSGCSYTGGLWGASGLLVYVPDLAEAVLIEGNSLTENQVNIYLAYCSATVDANNVYATATGTGATSFYGILGDPGETEAPDAHPLGLDEYSGGHGSTYNVTCTGNTLESDGSSGGTGIGIYAGMYGTYNIDFTATGNTVRYWQWGLELFEYTPNVLFAEIHYNNIEGNTDYGIYNYLNTVFDARYNWWGDKSGPYHPTQWSFGTQVITNPDGTGDRITDYLLYEPWLTHSWPAGRVNGGGWIAASEDKVTFGFDVQHQTGAVSGHFQLINHADKTKVRSVTITDLEFPMTESGTEARFSGTCSVNGEDGHTFICAVEDHGEPGKGVDHFITVIDNATSYDCLLGGGNIQVEIPVGGSQSVGTARNPDASIWSENSPNPFRTETAIRFNLPETKHTTLTIYDVTGRAVEILVDQELLQGIHTVNWKPDVPAGTYFYCLQAGDFTDMKKTIVLR